MSGKSGIDPKGLKTFRPDRRRYNDADETEGRALYRFLADKQARRNFSMRRRVALSTQKDKEDE